MNHVDEIAEAKGIGAKEFYGLRETAVILGLGKSTLHRQYQAGLVPFVAIGNEDKSRLLISSNTLQHWVDNGLLRNRSRREIAEKLRAKHHDRQLMFEPQDVLIQQANLYNDIKDCLPNGDVLLTLANLIDPAEQESADE